MEKGKETARADWPLGPELRRYRTLAGLSVKAAARRTKGEVSDGRWYQLESGYQRVAGQQIPITTTARTVIAVAKAVDWSVADALKIAGFDPREYREPQTAEIPVLITQVPIDDLLAEIKRRAIDGDLSTAARSTDPGAGKGRAIDGDHIDDDNQDRNI